MFSASNEWRSLRKTDGEKHCKVVSGGPVAGTQAHHARPAIYPHRGLHDRLHAAAGGCEPVFPAEPGVESQRGRARGSGPELGHRKSLSAHPGRAGTERFTPEVV